MMKANWVYCIIKSVEARLEYVKEETDGEEEETLKAILKYFKEIELSEVQPTKNTNEVIK